MIEGILRSVLNHRSELTAGLTRKSRRRHTEGTNPQQPAEAPTTGRFIGKGIGRLNGDSGGWRLWKDRRHGFALRTEHTSYNSSAAAFSSEKAARLRRCAETQKHFAPCRTPNNCSRFCLPENRAALNCPECHFSAGFLTLGAVEGYNKEKLRGANRVYQGNGRHFAIMSLPLDGTNNY